MSQRGPGKQGPHSPFDARLHAETVAAQARGERAALLAMIEFAALALLPRGVRQVRVEFDDESEPRVWDHRSVLVDSPGEGGSPQQRQQQLGHQGHQQGDQQPPPAAADDSLSLSPSLLLPRNGPATSHTAPDSAALIGGSQRGSKQGPESLVGSELGDGDSEDWDAPNGTPQKPLATRRRLDRSSGSLATLISLLPPIRAPDSGRCQWKLHKRTTRGKPRAECMYAHEVGLPFCSKHIREYEYRVRRPVPGSLGRRVSGDMSGSVPKKRRRSEDDREDDGGAYTPPRDANADGTTPHAESTPISPQVQAQAEIIRRYMEPLESPQPRYERPARPSSSSPVENFALENPSMANVHGHKETAPPIAATDGDSQSKSASTLSGRKRAGRTHQPVPLLQQQTVEDARHGDHGQSADK